MDSVWFISLLLGKLFFFTFCDLNSNLSFLLFFFFWYKTFDHFSHLSPFPSDVRAIYNLLTPTLLCSSGVLSLFPVGRVLFLWGSGTRRSECFEEWICFHEDSASAPEVFSECGLKNWKQGETLSSPLSKFPLNLAQDRAHGGCSLARLTLRRWMIRLLPPLLLLPLLLLSWQPYAHTQRPWSVLHGPEACLLATLFTCHWDFLACVSYQEAYKSWHTLGRQGCGFLTGPCVSGGTALKPGAITGGSP